MRNLQRFLFTLSDAYCLVVAVVKFAALLAGGLSHPGCLVLVPVLSLDFLLAVQEKNQVQYRPGRQHLHHLSGRYLWTVGDWLILHVHLRTGY